MDIYITGNLPKSEKDSGTSVKLQIPILPEAIESKKATRFTQYDIIGVGPVSVPTGEELNTYYWEAILPGKSNADHPMIRKFVEPETILNYFDTWKKYKVKLKLYVTDSDINENVYLESVEAKRSGPFGDYVYTIRFIEAKSILVSKKSKSSKSTAKTTTKKISSPKIKTYTIKRNDTLWGISVKYYKKGASWKKIYNKNKSVIEKAAKKHGRKSSSNGHWIYAGTKLIIP